MNDCNDTRAVMLGILATVTYTALFYVTFDWKWVFASDTSAMDILFAWLTAKMEWSIGFVAIWSSVCLAISRDMHRVSRIQSKRHARARS